MTSQPRTRRALCGTARAAITFAAAGLSTLVVASPTRGQEVPKREIAIVVRASTAPLFDSTGGVAGSGVRAVERLSERLAALHVDELASVPIALSIPGVVCDELRVLNTPPARRLLRELRRHARSSPVLSGTHADVRLSDLDAAQIAREVSEGAAAIQDCTGVAPRSLFVPPDLTLPTTEILEPLREAGAVVALSAFAVPPAPQRPSIVPAVAFDASNGVKSLLDARPEASAIAVVIDAGTTDVASVLNKLVDHPRFALRDVSALAKLDVVRGVIDTATDAPERYGRAIEQASEALTQLRSFTLPDNRNVATYSTVLARARGSGEWDDYRIGRRRADALRNTIRSELDVVSVPDGSVTFTSSRGSIPVTITSRARYPVRLRVHVSSPKLTFPAGPATVVTVEPPGDTITFDAIARSTGTFPTRVVVTSPRRELTLARGELIVRSTAANVSAVVLTAGGALFLVAWFIRRLRSRRTQNEAT